MGVRSNMTNSAEFNRRLRAAQRQAEQQMKQAVAAHNRKVDAENRRAVAEYNRKVDAQNRKALADYNRQIDVQNRKIDAANRKAIDDHNRRVRDHNRKAVAHNRRVVDEINRRLAAAARPQIRYTVEEQGLVDRVQRSLPTESRQHDIFMSYARIDGFSVATELHSELEQLGLDVWFDEGAIVAGKSQSLQMDRGLARARAGVVLLTPAYLTGRFWTERELGALLHKETLIPVLHGVTFADVAEYSGILPDLAGFTTDLDSVPAIAAKIAGAVLITD